MPSRCFDSDSCLDEAMAGIIHSENRVSTLGGLRRDAPGGVALPWLQSWWMSAPNGVHLSHDRMASLLAPYKNRDALEVAQDLDRKVEDL